MKFSSDTTKISEVSMMEQVCGIWKTMVTKLPIENLSCVVCTVGIITTCLVIMYTTWLPWNLHICEFYCFRMHFSYLNIMYTGLFLCCNGFQSPSIKSMVKVSLYSNNWIIYSLIRWLIKVKFSLYLITMPWRCVGKCM